MDRGLAALAKMRAREQLRARAVLMVQVGEDLRDKAGITCDDAMSAALSVDEGLLARLSASDAAAETASLVATAWAIAASGIGSSNPAERPKGMPDPLAVLQSSVGAIAR